LNKLKNLRDIPIGTKIELTVIDPSKGKLDIGFVSQIEDYIDEDVIRIAAPIFEAKVYPIRVRSHIEAYLFYNSNQVYRIAGFVENRLIADDIALIDLRVTEKIQIIQRRQFFRFECSVPIIFYGQQANGLEERNREIFGDTIDLSGGGLSALTKEPLNEKTQLKGKIQLDDDSLVDFDGEVIRCIKNIINNELKYISSINFIDIDYKKREKIVGFIFNQQRLLLNKGLR